MTGFLLRRFRGYGDTDAEIDENLIRADLTAMERGEHLQRRKELHEARYPETRHGGDRTQHREQDAESASCSVSAFADDVARKTGRKKRTIQEDVQIANAIPQDVRDAIRDTPLADRKDDLLKLSRMDADEQRQVADAVRRGSRSM